MLKRFIEIGCILVCTDMIASATSTSIDHSASYQNSAKKVDVGKASEFPGNKSSLKMLEDITAKVWRVLPVVEIPRNWVLAYCMKQTEIFEQVEKAGMQCQYDGMDWDCTFIELGGGRDDFNMGKIVSSFHELSDQNLRSKMLRGAETCGKLWQQYKAVQEERLIQMRLTAKSRRKRHLKRDRRSRGSQSVWKRSNEKKNRKQSKELREALFAAEKIKQFQQSLMSKFTELEKKKHLNSEEQNELDRLHLTVTTKTRDDLEEYPLNEERTELTRLQEVGLCISRETARACESIVLDAVEKLI